jgi:hypothetical protein
MTVKLPKRVTMADLVTALADALLDGRTPADVYDILDWVRTEVQEREQVNTTNGEAT